ncbi:MAG: MSMEG_4193 family putative phosphomutase [Streptosporangiaceae bacterium]
MTLVLVVRHGLTSSTGKALTGWMPGISLDDRGQAQAAALGSRLAQVPLAAIVSSPLDRCRETAAAIASRQELPEPASAPDPEANGSAPPARTRAVDVQLDDRLGECRYGDWTGQPLRKLARDPLWKVVQAHPSAVRFPGADGESMMAMQQRAVAAVLDWNDKLGKDAIYLICSHGDVIKAILADALGMHLDMSQRIQIDPCSLSIIRYTTLRPFVLRMNDTGSDSPGLARRPAEVRAGAEADAQIGGGAGGVA